MQQREQRRTSPQSHSMGLYAQDTKKKSRLTFQQEQMVFLGFAAQMEFHGDFQLIEPNTLTVFPTQSNMK